MARTRSPSSSIRFAKLVALATVGLLAAVGLRGERADACGGGMYLGIEDVTTFDPSIVGDWDGLAYNPYESSFGGACDDCLAKTMLADWTTYLTGVTVDDWKKILLTATEADLVSLRAKAAGKSTAATGLLKAGFNATNSS